MQITSGAPTPRTKILQVLDDRPASAKQLSDLLNMSHGKIGHHLKVLERHGFVEVVETRQVRAMTEKLYAALGGADEGIGDDDNGPTAEDVEDL